VLAAAVRACRGDDGWSFDDYHSGRRYAPLEEAVRRDVAASASPGFAENARVCVAAGTAQLVTSYLSVFARRGNALLVVRPHYHGVTDWCTAAGVEVVTVRSGRETAFRGCADDLDDALRRARGRRVCGLLLANPTFTGAIYGKTDLETIEEWARRRAITLLVDTAFRRTEYGERPPAAVCGGGVADEAVVVLGGASKAYNLANLRVAWAVGGRDVIGAIEAHRERVMGAVPFLGQAMAAAALGAPAAYLRENAAECAARAAIVTRWVAQVNATARSGVLRVEHAPEAGHAVLLSLSADAVRGRALPDGGRLDTSVDLCRYLLQRHQVAVSPAYSQGFGGLEFRVSFGAVGAKSTYEATRAAERSAVAAAATATAGKVAPESTESSDVFAEGRRVLEDALGRLGGGILRVAG
jgi:aspartate aminotransferase